MENSKELLEATVQGLQEKLENVDYEIEVKKNLPPPLSIL